MPELDLKATLAKVNGLQSCEDIFVSLTINAGLRINTTQLPLKAGYMQNERLSAVFTVLSNQEITT